MSTGRHEHVDGWFSLTPGLSCPEYCRGPWRVEWSQLPSLGSEKAVTTWPSVPGIAEVWGKVTFPVAVIGLQMPGLL
jgi:hypothetical protein